METITLGYHDVISANDARTPRSASVYTISEDSFAHQLRLIHFAAGPWPIAAVDGDGGSHERRLHLTFDDGAACAFTHTAPSLESHGWPGHFFVTTDWIGRPGFLEPSQIRELDRRGHVIGSHSCSHPERMSHLGWDDLRREWSDSCAALGEILGRRVTVASVAGGYYTRRVARAAAACGIKVLFTSEPTAAAADVDGCLVLGRYVVRRSTSPRAVAAIVSGAKLPRLEQAVVWSAKKALKRITGTYYDTLRQGLGYRIPQP